VLPFFAVEHEKVFLLLAAFRADPMRQNRLRTVFSRLELSHLVEDGEGVDGLL